MKKKVFLMIAVAVCMAISVNAQNLSESKYGIDSASCVTNLSMYREYYKQWEASKYAPEAISMKMVKAWREVFLNCPRASQYTYTNGEKIMEYFIRTNPAQKDAYIDTLCMLMDLRAQYFPNNSKTGASQVANIMGRKGLLIYTYNKNRYEEAYNVLKDAVSFDPANLQEAYLDAYYKTATDMVNNGKLDKMPVVEELSVNKPQDKERTIKNGSVYIGNVKSPEQVAAYGTPAWVFSTMSISFIDNICLLVFNNCVYSINMYTGGLGNAMTSSTSEATQVNYLVNNGNVYVWDPTKGTPKNDSDYLFVFRIEDEHLNLIKAKEKSYQLGKYIYMSDYNKMKKMSEEELIKVEKEALGKLKLLRN